MKTVFKRVALAAAAASALTLPVAAQADLTTATSGPFTYVCGGVAQDEQQQLRSEASHYDMGLLFTKGSNGEYLADVNVKLLRNGKQVAEFTSDGPRCLIKGPRASYQVVATYEGASKRTTLSPGARNVQLRW
ncbi:hypothetical protein [Cupriavidus pauculus]|jgi:hypothetical protein|uniref:hypothetical protein n=1 Tax=Cupriavidus pauculus TaxID=82633 RepID=UPI001CC2878E|nr:hypothetical protein [Cupriavidus pauculus]